MHEKEMVSFSRTKSVKSPSILETVPLLVFLLLIVALKTKPLLLKTLPWKIIASCPKEGKTKTNKVAMNEIILFTQQK